MKRQSLIVPASGLQIAPTRPWHYDAENETEASTHGESRRKRKLPSSLAQPDPPPDPVKVTIEERFEILFPFEPYDCQQAFIRKLSAALLKQENALLESPTGTGKTMCLLATVLAFQFGCLENRLPFSKRRGGSEEAARAKKALDNDALLQGFDDLFEETTTTTTTTTTTSRASGEEHAADAETSLPPSVKKETDRQRASKLKLTSMPRVWYASRTHSQLKQVVGELKRTPYYSMCREPDPSFGIRLIIIGSRDHYCINPELADRKGRALESQCRKVSVNRTCLWHNGCNRELVKADVFARYTMDIEEARALALGGGDALKPFCPFYASRETQQTATFILLPYNYLVNPLIREQMKIDVAGDIVVIDEGHNIESTSEEETSFSFTELDLTNLLAAIEIAEKLLEVKSEAQADMHLSFDDVNELQSNVRLVIEKLVHVLTTAELRPLQLSGRLTSEVCAVWTLAEFRAKHLTTIGLTAERCDSWSALLKRFQLHLEYYEFHVQDTRVDTRSFVNWAWIAGSMSSYLRYFWRDSVSDSIGRFRVGIFVTQVQTTARRASTAGHRDSTAAGQNDIVRQFQFWCFAPHVGLEGITGVCHSLIITSGTLKPLDALALQLGNTSFKFPHQLENQHVIQQNQLFSVVVGMTLADRPINLSYENLKKAGPSLMVDVGHIILDIVSASPREGHLVFFASYSQLHNFVDTWGRNQIMFQLQRKINVFREPKAADEATLEIKRFCMVVSASAKQKLPDDFDKSGSARLRASYDLTQGGVFFGVCRGRVSEGLSLSDSLVRTVTIIGIPYPSLADVKLYTKRAILDANPYRGGSSNQIVNGSQWYMRQAYQAVNQAIGRVIRHKDDYGAIVFLDGRYSEALPHLSGWVRSNIVLRKARGRPEHWAQVKPDLQQFFGARNASKSLTATTGGSENVKQEPRKRMMVKAAHPKDDAPPPSLPKQPRRNPPKGTPTLGQLFASRNAMAPTFLRPKSPTKATEETVTLGGGGSSEYENRFKRSIRAAHAEAMASLLNEDIFDEIK